jgi:succinoglycan biosynthesis protein ExoA
VKRRPELSVVLALRDAEADLEELLGAIAAQSLPRADYEVIVALGPSRDRSDELLRRAQRNRGLDLLIENPEGYAAPGLNRAIAIARAPFVLRLDARSRPAADYFARNLTILRRAEFGCVGGAMIPEGRGFVGQAFAAAMRGPLGTGGAAFRRIPSRAEDVDTVYLGAWPRERLIECGGFDESLRRNQDDELARRLRAAGHRILLDPTLRSRYRVRESIPALLRQYFRYGLEKPAALRGHFADIALRQLAPPALVLFAAFASLALLHPLARHIALPALLGVGILHLALGFLTTAPAPILRRAFAAPLLLGIHLAYGGGFLLGWPRLLFAPAPRPGLAARLRESLD